MKFKTGGEMLQMINSGIDLYSPTLELYVFSYNDRGAIAYYHIDKSDAVALEMYAQQNDDYWAGSLGPGGCICDAPEDDPVEGCRNIDFCDRYYDEEWIKTTDVFHELGDFIDSTLMSYWDNGYEIHQPCKINRKTREVIYIPVDYGFNVFHGYIVEIDDKLFPVDMIDNKKGTDGYWTCYVGSNVWRVRK